MLLIIAYLFFVFFGQRLFNRISAIGCLLPTSLSLSLSLLSFSFLNFPHACKFFSLEGSSHLSLFLSSFCSVTVNGYGLWVFLKVSKKLKVLPCQTSFKIYNKTPYLFEAPHISCALTSN